MDTMYFYLNCGDIQSHHFCLTELEDETFKRRRQKEFEVRRMRTVSASMEYKPTVSLVPRKHQCGVYNPRASLVPRLPW